MGRSGAIGAQLTYLDIGGRSAPGPDVIITPFTILKTKKAATNVK